MAKKEFSISNKRRLQLIKWLQDRFYEEDPQLPIAKLMWRKGNNKALYDVIELLKHDGEYRLATIEEVFKRIGYKVPADKLTDSPQTTIF